MGLFKSRPTRTLELILGSVHEQLRTYASADLGPDFRWTPSEAARRVDIAEQKVLFQTRVALTPEALGTIREAALIRTAAATGQDASAVIEAFRTLLALRLPQDDEHQRALRRHLVEIDRTHAPEPQ